MPSGSPAGKVPMTSARNTTNRNEEITGEGDGATWGGRSHSERIHASTLLSRLRSRQTKPIACNGPVRACADGTPDGVTMNVPKQSQFVPPKAARRESETNPKQETRNCQGAKGRDGPVLVFWISVLRACFVFRDSQFVLAPVASASKSQKWGENWFDRGGSCAKIRGF